MLDSVKDTVTARGAKGPSSVRQLTFLVFLGDDGGCFGLTDCYFQCVNMNHKGAENTMKTLGFSILL